MVNTTTTRRPKKSARKSKSPTRSKTKRVGRPRKITSSTRPGKSTSSSHTKRAANPRRSTAKVATRRVGRPRKTTSTYIKRTTSPKRSTAKVATRRVGRPRKTTTTKRETKSSTTPRVKGKIVLRKRGSLKKYGYSTKIDTSERHKALRKAIKDGKNAVTVRKRLIAVANLQINTNPKVSAILRDDANFINEHYIV